MSTVSQCNWSTPEGVVIILRYLHLNFIASTTFYYNVSKEWNSRPEDLRAIENKHSFQRELKKYLFIRAE